MKPTQIKATSLAEFVSDIKKAQREYEKLSPKEKAARDAAVSKAVSELSGMGGFAAIKIGK